MNKCFITKLPSSVDNDNLPVLGQLRINWLKQSDLTDNGARAIGLATNDSITVKVSGAHLTDSTLASNFGNTKTITAADNEVWLYVSNDADAVLTIDNKYSLTELNFVKSEGNYNLKRSVYFDLADIKYCSNIKVLRLSNTQVNGDISDISNITNLYNLALNNTSISGDISIVSNFTKLESLRIGGTKISGDISAISKLTNLVFLALGSSKISGDISAVRNLTRLSILDLQKTQVSGDISAVSKLINLTELYLMNNPISGDIANLANLTKLGDILQLSGMSLIGDVSKIPVSVTTMMYYNRPINTNFTWTANGRQNTKFLAMIQNIPFDTASMDNMLIDQATCTFEGTNEPWTKTISVSGTRTSASDAAVAALQNKGVTIIGVTKQA